MATAVSEVAAANATAAPPPSHVTPALAAAEVVWRPSVIFRVTTIAALMLLTLLGNAALLLMILCNRRLRKRRVNVFLVNLAIGDILVCLVTMSTEILFVAFGEWVLGALACKLTVYGQIVTLASTTFLLTAMSIDRYQTIVCPLQSLKGQPKIWRKVLAAWLMALVFATPQLFIFVQSAAGTHSDGSVRHVCRSDGYTHGQTWQRKAYFTFLTAYILIVPTAIMSFCYFNIVRVVFIRAGEQPAAPKLKFTSARRANDSRPSSSETYSELECSVQESGAAAGVGSERGSRQWSGRSRLSIPKQAFSSSKQNIVKMTLTVIIAFVVCWSPYFLVGLIRIYSNYHIELTLTLSIAELMAMFHSLLNPIIYGTFSRKAIVKTFRTSCAKRNKEKIVIDISLGSDFDSLVFVTNPDLYIESACAERASGGGAGGCRACFKRLCGLCCRPGTCSHPSPHLRKSSIELDAKHSRNNTKIASSSARAHSLSMPPQKADERRCDRGENNNKRELPDVSQLRRLLHSC